MKKIIFILLFSIFPSFISFSQEAETFYEDGRVLKKIEIGNITVMTSLRGAKRAYGKYYQFDVSIANHSNSKFNLLPKKMSAVATTKKGKKIFLKVLSRKEYMKKVKSKQMWGSVLSGVASGLSTMNAGKSTSRTTGSSNTYSSGNINTNASATGSNGSYVYGSANTNYSGTSATHSSSTTNTYNSSEAYAIQENENRKLLAQERMKDQLKNSLNKSYLKRHTLNVNETIVGRLNVKYKKAVEVVLTIPINGKDFVFVWDPNDL